MMNLAHMLVWTVCSAGVSAEPGVNTADRVELIGVASVAGDERDRSRLRTVLGGKIPASRLGSFGSGIDYTGADNVYLACDDRGPGDGAYEFRTRVQRLRIVVDAGAEFERRVVVELMNTTLLSDEQGAGLTGYSGAFDATVPAREWPRFDPEAIRCVAGGAGGVGAGSFFLADEYGPRIDLFGPDGRRVRSLEVPAKFTIARPDRDGEMELPPSNARGRQANRGFEGLAISPDGSTFWAILQSPLIQDGGLDGDNNRVGRNVRVLELSTSAAGGGSTAREWVYPLNNSKDGVSEILAAGPERFLVLERDGKGGVEARRRGVYLADAKAASDVSGVDALPARDLPASITPMHKTLLVDFMDPRLSLMEASRGGMPEKIEGLCFGPDLPDGRKALIVTTDNDLKADVPTWIWVFAVSAGALE
jgi:hypothetical protein